MAEVKVTLFNEIIKYAQKEKPTNSDRNTIVDTIFFTLDKNHNGKLEESDKISSFYKQYFGIELSSSVTRETLKEKIDDIASTTLTAEELEFLNQKI